MLYSVGTPIRRGVFFRRVDWDFCWRWERIRDREEVERLVGSWGSCLFKRAVKSC